MDNKSAIIRLKRAGLRNCQIAPMLSVSKQYVSRICQISCDANCQVKRKGRNGFVTIRMASLILGIHESKVRRWADAGKLTSLRIGGNRGDRRFNLTDVWALFEEQQAIGGNSIKRNIN